MSIAQELTKICNRFEQHRMPDNGLKKTLCEYNRRAFWRYVEMIHALQHFRAANVLSVGLGCGVPEVYLQEHQGCHISAIDKQWKTSTWNAFAAASGIQVVPCELGRDKMPFVNREFDLIILTEVIEHLRFSANVALRELGRLLRKEGRLFVSTPNATSVHYIFRMLKGRNIFPSVPCDFVPNGSNGHITDKWMHLREWTLPELVEVVEDAGLTVESAWHGHCANLFRFVRATSPASLVGWAFAKLVPWLRGQLYVIAKNG